MSTEIVTSDVDEGSMSRKKKRKSPFWQGEVKPYPGSVFVRRGSNRIYIQYKKKRVATGLPLTRANIQIAIAMVTDLWRDYHGYPTLKTKAAVTLLPLSPAPATPNIATGLPNSEFTSPTTSEIPAANEPALNARDEKVFQEESQEVIPTIGEVIAEYTDVYLAARDLEDKTIGGYVDAMNYIAVDRELPVTHDNLVAQVQKWLLTADQHFSSGSINTHLRGFRTLTTWLIDTKKVLTDRVSYKKYWRKRNAEAEVLIYERDVLDILIYYYEECEAPKGFSDGYLRETAELMKFLRAVGTRIKETLTLDKSQFALGRIALPNKITKKVDYIPMTDEIRGIMDRVAAIRAREAEMQADPNNKLYIASFRSDYQDDIDRSDRIFRWSEASVSSLLRHIKKTMKLLGLDVKGGWHTFRRTFADELHQADIDLHTRQKLLRHASPETTVKFYTYTHGDRLESALKRAASRLTVPVEERVHTPH